MQRFYEEVHVVATEEGFELRLDDRPVRTPGRQPQTLPSRTLAEAVADEWRAQTDQVDPLALPLTRLINTALDRVAPRRDDVVEHIIAHAETDLLCFRATDPALAALQAERWQPLLDDLHARRGVSLPTTTGLGPLDHDPDALTTLSHAVSSLDDLHLTALLTLAVSYGSLTLALAVLDQQLDVDHALSLSLLPENHQAQRWGEDPSLAQRRDALSAEVHAAAHLLSLLRDSP